MPQRSPGIPRDTQAILRSLSLYRIGGVSLGILSAFGIPRPPRQPRYSQASSSQFIGLRAIGLFPDDISHMINLHELSTIKIIFTWSKQAYHNYTILYTHYMYMYRFFDIRKTTFCQEKI